MIDPIMDVLYVSFTFYIVFVLFFYHCPNFFVVYDSTFGCIPLTSVACSISVSLNWCCGQSKSGRSVNKVYAPQYDVAYLPYQGVKPFITSLYVCLYTVCIDLSFSTLSLLALLYIGLSRLFTIFSMPGPLDTMHKMAQVTYWRLRAS